MVDKELAELISSKDDPENLFELINLKKVIFYS